ACGWMFNLSPTVCGESSWSLDLVNVGGAPKFNLQLMGVDATALWVATGFKDCLSPITLTYNGGATPSTNQCDYSGSTLTLTPIAPAANTDPQTVSGCIPALAAGCAPGSNLGPSPVPYLGAVSECAPVDTVPACGCGSGGGCGTGNAAAPGCVTAPVQ